MSGKKALIVAILLVAALVLVAGCAGGSKTAKTGDNVTVDYIGSYDNGTIFDTSLASVAQQNGIYEPTRTYEPIPLIIGNGDVIPGFENGIVGMKVGDTKNITIAAADAYGETDPSAIQPINMSEFLALNLTPYVNETIDGVYYWPVRVDSISINDTDYNNSTVYVDFNHPLAGRTLHFQITLRTLVTPAATPTPTP